MEACPGQVLSQLPSQFCVEKGGVGGGMDATPVQHLHDARHKLLRNTACTGQHFATVINQTTFYKNQNLLVASQIEQV